MRSITILCMVLFMSLSAQNTSAQSLLDRFMPILEDVVGSKKDTPKATPVAVQAPTPSVVKKVVAKVKGGKNQVSPPPSSIESDVPSTIISDAPSAIMNPDVLESSVPSTIISDVPSNILSDAPSDFGSDFPSFSP